MGNKHNKIENKNLKNNIEKEQIKTQEKVESNKKDIYKYNILFIGENGVGTKTSLIKRIIEGKFIKIKKDNKEKCENLILEKDNKQIILYLIDTNGNKDKRDLCKIYYKKVDYVIMGYDCTNKETFQEIINYWYNQIKEFVNADHIYLLGNKYDLHNSIVITEKEGKLFADTNKIKYFSISVKNNINIDNFINDLKINIENNIENDKHINNGINEIIYGNPSKENYKVVLLGESGVGSKTSFINVVVKNKFDPNCQSTSGASYSGKIIYLNNGKYIGLDIWDTAGQEKYRDLTTIFIKEVDCVMLGYDVTRRESFENIKFFWYNHYKENSDNDLIYLLGNKIDLDEDRYVDENEARKYCEEKNIRYFEISCKESIGLKELFDDLTNQLIKR